MTILLVSSGQDPDHFDLNPALPRLAPQPSPLLEHVQARLVWSKVVERGHQAPAVLQLTMVYSRDIPCTIVAVLKSQGKAVSDGEQRRTYDELRCLARLW